MSGYEQDMVMAPLDYMLVRVVGSPECPEQAKWVGRKGKVFYTELKRLSAVPVKLCAAGAVVE